MANGSAFVPVAPFRALLEKRLKQLEHGGFEEAPMTRLAHEVGLDERMVWRALNESKKLEFRVADIIVTKLYGPMYWHEDETLSEIYWGVDLAKEDLINPLESDFAQAESDRRVIEAWDSSRNRTEAAEKLGLQLATFSHILDPALRRAGLPRTKPNAAQRPRTRLTQCKRNHDISVVGRNRFGACRACKRESDRNRLRAKREAAA